MDGPPGKKQRTKPLPREFHMLKGLRTSVNNELEVAASTPRKLDCPELDVKWEGQKILEDELGIHRAAFRSCVHTQLKFEGTIERWRSRDVKARTDVTYGVGEPLYAIDPQIPKVRELTNEIKDPVVISPWIFQFQGFQGPQKCPEVLLYLRDKGKRIQPTSLEAPEICEGAEVSDMGLQLVCEERNIMGKGDRKVASVLKETTFA